MKKNPRGFTLLEVLIALFIFTIVSMLMMGALRTVINTAEKTEVSAEELSTLQMAFLSLSRDVTQTVNRPVKNTSGKEELALFGDENNLWLTHADIAMQDHLTPEIELHRTRYFYKDNVLWRASTNILDPVKTVPVKPKALIKDVSKIKFEFLDDKNQFQKTWPLSNQQITLPKAVKITLYLDHLGSVSQLYMISLETEHARKVDDES